MQHTRQRILDILKLAGEATVDELSQQLELTAVTIRHHLEVLRSESLIAPPEARRRVGPGRPQYVYRLANEASNYFPKNYDLLARAMLTELEQQLTDQEMADLVRRIAERMAAEVDPDVNASLAARLEATVEFLNDLGYLASAELGADGRYRLHVANCPYEQVARRHVQPCQIDELIISHLLGVAPERLEQIVRGDNRCTYLLPPEASSR